MLKSRKIYWISWSARRRGPILRFEYDKMEGSKLSWEWWMAERLPAKDWALQHLTLTHADSFDILTF
jgi:hypothetical protein